MAKRLISSTGKNPTNGRAGKVYRDTEWGEWVVAMLADDTQVGTYHTDDKDDAVSTCNGWHSGVIQ